MNKMEKILLISILIIAVLTRLPFLQDFPKGFSGDEAGQGYNAYSILKTGKDEWGEFMPTVFRSFGDFKPPLYIYLTVPSVALLGLNEYAVRLPAALVGIALIFVTFLLSRQIFGNTKIALWTAFLLSISPWHIQLSRTASEGGPGILFFSLGLLFYLKSRVNSKYLIWVVLCWGIVLYSYHSLRVFMALFLAGAFLTHFLKFKDFKSWKILIIVALFVVPLLLGFKENLARSSDVGIFSAKTIEGYYQSKGTSPVPYQIDRIFDNKVTFVLGYFTNNYLSYISPAFLFTGSRDHHNYLNFPNFGLLYPIEAVFWAIGIFVFIRSGKKDYLLLLLWFVLAPVAGALTSGGPQANRVVTYLPLTALLSGFGIYHLIDLLKRPRIFKRLPWDHIFVFIMLLNFVMFIYFYGVKAFRNPPESLRYEYKQIFQKALELQPLYDEIVFSKSFSVPHAFVAFYGKVDPLVVQEASRDWIRYEKSGNLYIDQLESWNLKNFYFEDINWLKKDSLRKNALIIARPGDFPTDVVTIYDVKDSKGKILYKFVPVKNDQKN